MIDPKVMLLFCVASNLYLQDASVILEKLQSFALFQRLIANLAIYFSTHHAL